MFFRVAGSNAANCGNFDLRFKSSVEKSESMLSLIADVFSFTSSAGVGTMRYRTFFAYNVVGGLLWAVGVTSLGYFLGNVSLIADHVELALLAVVAISLLPIGFEAIRSRRGRSSRPSVGT